MVLSVAWLVKYDAAQTKKRVAELEAFFAAIEG